MKQENLIQYRSLLKFEQATAIIFLISALVFFTQYYSGSYHTEFALALFVVVILLCFITLIAAIKVRKKRINLLSSMILERFGHYSGLNVRFIMSNGWSQDMPKVDKYFKKCKTENEFLELIKYFNTQYSVECYQVDQAMYKRNKKDPEFIKKFIAHKAKALNKDDMNTMV